MKIELQKGERIIRKSGANHFKGAEGVGGMLYLTNQRIFFNSHKINIQKHELSIPIANIKSVEKVNTLGIIPNGMQIKLKDGGREKFVIWRRGKWIEDTQNLVDKR